MPVFINWSQTKAKAFQSRNINIITQTYKSVDSGILTYLGLDRGSLIESTKLISQELKLLQTWFHNKSISL